MWRTDGAGGIAGRGFRRGFPMTGACTAFACRAGLYRGQVTVSEEEAT